MKKLAKDGFGSAGRKLHERTGICFLLMLLIVFSCKAYGAQSQGKSEKSQSDITYNRAGCFPFSGRSGRHVENKVEVEKGPDFAGWDVWKERNRQGLDCEVTIRRDKNQISMYTGNLGITIKSVTKVFDNVQDIYVALTGDQCAITNISVSEIHPELLSRAQEQIPSIQEKTTH